MNTFRIALAYISVIALATMALCVAFCYLGARIRRWLLFLGPSGVITIVPMISALVVHGSTKGPTSSWSFTFSNGLYDDGSYCTNDLIVARWSCDVAVADYDVAAAWRNATITNSVGETIDDWHELESCKVNFLTNTWIVPDATNCHVMVWAVYVRPPAVHTNGVYKLNGVARAIGEPDSTVAPKFVPTGFQLRSNSDSGGVEILTPTNRPAGYREHPFLTGQNGGEE